jgi:hypothetical protein
MKVMIVKLSRAIIAASLVAGCHAGGSRLPTGSAPTVPGTRDSIDRPVRIDGGDGRGCQNAVVIHAPSDHDAVQAAFAWLEEHYPGYQYLGAGLSPSVTVKGQESGEAKVYDIFSIELMGGEHRGVCFDITESWGK